MSNQLDNLEFHNNRTFFDGVTGNINGGTQQFWNDIQGQGEGVFNKLKTTVGIGGPQKDPTFYEEVQQQSSFTYVQRLTVFLVLMAIGVGFIIMSTFFIFAPKTFAKFYTIGSLCVIIGLVFLVGLKKQYQNIISSKERLYSTLIYLSSIFGTLYCALGLKSTILTMFLVICQFISVVWYSLSYIPFGQAMLSSITTKLFGLSRRRYNVIQPK
ncbi:hypothetical protein DFA_03816 [Cavenderia fasciculata]|uniref:Vesicle transport protein n=1 Tax=Cavenderia fasciculata TaxID=261658 RepID=F4Q0H1_CACFS|nr:uncharacterized protein DFA_03816 [Cavenderia fasciculata]EGG18322.1 hypothetical protein DFA_03816 [Cavenderia fasciculata]|eukprot:XP_004366226.1 hypothetical protein DFA_03816 [Cavenderia fasciculata]